MNIEPAQKMINYVMHESYPKSEITPGYIFDLMAEFQKFLQETIDLQTRYDQLLETMPVEKEDNK